MNIPDFPKGHNWQFDKRYLLVHAYYDLNSAHAGSRRYLCLCKKCKITIEIECNIKLPDFVNFSSWKYRNSNKIPESCEEVIMDVALE